MVLATVIIWCASRHKKQIHYRSYKNFEDDKFTIIAWSYVPFHVSEVFDDIDDSYWFFNCLLTDVISEHAPVKTKILKRSQVPYMNSKLRKGINVKNMLWRKYKKHRSQFHWEKYRVQRNYVTKLRKQSMNSYLMNKCNGPKTGKEFWGAVKPLISNKYMSSNDNIMLLENEQIIREPNE